MGYVCTQEQQAYINEHKLHLVQEAGVDSLYNSVWGCRTIQDIIQMHECQVRYNKKVAEQHQKMRASSRVSDALMILHERCVDEYGCGLFSS